MLRLKLNFKSRGNFQARLPERHTIVLLTFRYRSHRPKDSLVKEGAFALTFWRPSVMTRSEAIRAIVATWLQRDEVFCSTEEQSAESQKALSECLGALGVSENDEKMAFAELDREDPGS